MTARADGENPLVKALLALSAPFGQKFEGPLECQPLRVVSSAQARIRLAVGDVRPESTVLDDERPSALGVRPQLLEWRLWRASPAALLWLRENRLRLLGGEGQQLLLRSE